jgi:hypothetical protein
MVIGLLSSMVFGLLQRWQSGRDSLSAPFVSILFYFILFLSR